MCLENGIETPRESYSLLLCLQGSPFLILWRSYKALQSEGHSHTSCRPEPECSPESWTRPRIRELALWPWVCHWLTAYLWMSQPFSSRTDNSESRGTLNHSDFRVGSDPLGRGGGSLGISILIIFSRRFLGLVTSGLAILAIVSSPVEY